MDAELRRIFENRFKTEDERYRWLNSVIGVWEGEFNMKSGATTARAATVIVASGSARLTSVIAGKAITADVPLSEMFGYATTVRSMSQGRATFTMEFAKYVEVPPNIADGIIKK